jgi:hypothetical protein
MFWEKKIEIRTSHPRSTAQNTRHPVSHGPLDSSPITRVLITVTSRESIDHELEFSQLLTLPIFSISKGQPAGSQSSQQLPEFPHFQVINPRISRS